MDIIIKTGFEKISHSIEFTDQAIEKGKELSESHVIRVQEVRCNGVSQLISGRLIRRTSVNKEPYIVKLEVS